MKLRYYLLPAAILRGYSFFGLYDIKKLRDYLLLSGRTLRYRYCHPLQVSIPKQTKVMPVYTKAKKGYLHYSQVKVMHVHTKAK